MVLNEMIEVGMQLQSFNAMWENESCILVKVESGISGLEFVIFLFASLKHDTVSGYSQLRNTLCTY